MDGGVMATAAQAAVGWDMVLHAATQTMTSLITLLIALSPILPQLITLIGGFFKNQQHRRVFEEVSRAGLIAASVGASEIRKAQGAGVVTGEQRARAVAAAVAAATEFLARRGTMDSAVTVYGDKATVESSLESIVLHKWYGSSVAGDHGTVSVPSVAVAPPEGEKP